MPVTPPSINQPEGVAASSHGSGPGSLGEPKRDLARRVPPLVSILVAVVIAVFVLPSSLNVPQSNPQTVASFAPVPPDDDKTPPVQSNGDSFSLGGSEGLANDGQGGTGLGDANPPPPVDTATVPADLQTPDTLAQAKSRSTKRCVGSPPRQSEDPLAPPCVASFDESTKASVPCCYQGVTRDEVTILIYEDGHSTIQTSRGADEVSPNSGTYSDLDAPEADNDYIDVRNDRIWMKYFNERFQTYGRRVHGYIYWTNAKTAEARRADAAENTSGQQIPAPFAVLDQATFSGFRDAYRDAMARRGVMQFLSIPGIPAAQLTQYKPYVWSFQPDVEHLADLYITYICQRVVGQKVSRTGNPGELGKDRVYGMFSTSDPGYAPFKLLADYVAEGVKKCGADIKTRQYYPREGYVADNAAKPDYAVQAIAAFRAANVTTILWPGGVETKLGQAAGNYNPEIFALGTGNNDHAGSANRQAPAFWANARMLMGYTYQPTPAQAPEAQAFRDAAGSSYPQQDIQFAYDVYRDIFQMFRAIQVSGPNLRPSSVDVGFHAIPKVASNDPTKQAGFYDQGDYSYIKDVADTYWDINGTTPGANTVKGCYRMVEGGKRYLSASWGAGDDFGTGRAKPTSDPCNSVARPVQTYLAPS